MDAKTQVEAKLQNAELRAQRAEEEFRDQEKAESVLLVGRT